MRKLLAEPRLPLAVSLLGLALAIAAFNRLPHDDAYIAFRYAENAALGRGLVFNPGERVLGFTSPLHVLLATAAHVLVGHAWLPRVMAALGCVGWWMQSVCVYRLLAPACGRGQGLVLGGLLAIGGACSWQWVALETNLAVALSLAALVLGLADAWLAGAAALALACLMRPDALIMAGVIGAYGWRRLGRKGLRPLALFLGMTLPWPLFASAYYGSPVPEPLRVKVGRTNFLDYLAHVTREAALTLFGDSEPEQALIVVAWVLAVWGAVKLVRRERRLGLFVAYGGLHFAVYLGLRPFRAHTWHLYPGVVVFCVCAWTALVVRTTPAHARHARWVAVAAVGALGLVYAQRTLDFALSYPTAHWFGARDRTYRAVAAYLGEHARPGERVAAVEVGTLAYASDLPMHDLGGLVTKDAAIVKYPPRPYAWLVADSHYSWLDFPGREPVQTWDGEFPARLYLERR